MFSLIGKKYTCLTHPAFTSKLLSVQLFRLASLNNKEPTSMMVEPQPLNSLEVPQLGMDCIIQCLLKKSQNYYLFCILSILNVSSMSIFFPNKCINWKDYKFMVPLLCSSYSLSRSLIIYWLHAECYGIERVKGLEWLIEI